MPLNRSLHKNAALNIDRHGIHCWEFANAADRAAGLNTDGDTIAFTADDVSERRVGLQVDDLSLWVLTAVTPTWSQLNAANVSTVATGLASEVTRATTAEGNLTTALNALAEGRTFKDAVRAATTANITLSGAQTIDGVSIIAGDRVLVKSQLTGSQNGIYVCAAGAWTRAIDMDAAAEFPSSTIAVQEGTSQADTTWTCTNDAPVTVGSTAIVFVQTGAGTTATTTTHGALINSATSKSTPVDADMVGLMDSAASNILKKLSWLNIKATLKTYFDTLYAAVGSGFSNPMTTAGDLIIGGSSGTPTRLAASTSGYVLTATGAGAAPSWQAAGGGGASLTSDSYIASLTPTAWFKANAGVENTAGVAATNGQSVLNWLDQSGNNYTLTQATGTNKPTYVTGVQNGLPAVRFDGSNDYLFASSFPAIDLSNCTMLLVAKAANNTVNMRFVVIGASSTGNDYDNAARIEVESADTSFNFRVQGGTGSEFALALNGTRPGPAAVYSFRTYRQAGVVTINDVGLNGAGTDTSTTLTNSVTGLLLGCAYISSAIAATTAPLNGDIYEIAIFPRGLGDSARGLATELLRQKWAV